MDRHQPPENGLFERLLGRRVMKVEVESDDWIGISFDNGEYLSIYATPEYGEPAFLEVGFRRRCPEPYRRETDGVPIRRCQGFQDHGGRHS